jgi:hypothetical protein
MGANFQQENDMTPMARAYCHDAMRNILEGDYDQAKLALRIALRETRNPRAWSKLMLAIRELSRVTPSAS